MAKSLGKILGIAILLLMPSASFAYNNLDATPVVAVSGDLWFELTASTTIESVTFYAGAVPSLISPTSIISWNIGESDQPDNINTCVSESFTVEEIGIPFVTSYSSDFDSYGLITVNFTGDCSFPSGNFLLNSSVAGYVLGLSSTFNYAEGNMLATNYSQNTLPTFNFVEGIQSIENTRFLNATITANASAPKDVKIGITYYLDPNEVNRNVSALNPTTVTVKYANRTNLQFSTLGFAIATSTGTGTVLATIPDGSISDSGTFDLLIQFSNGGCAIGLSPCPFPDSYIYTDFTLTGKAVSAVGLLENYNYLPPTAGDREYVPCGITDLGGCLINVGIFLMTPSQESVDTFNEKTADLYTRSPFVYASQIPDIVGNLFPTATENFDFGVNTALGHVSFFSTAQIQGLPYTSTIRSMIEWSLWLGMAFLLYRKVMAIHDTHVS